MSVGEDVELEEEEFPKLLPEGVEDDDVFRAHSAVEVQTIDFREYSPSLDVVAQVRHDVGDALQGLGLDAECIFACQLVADELATNAVTHAGTIFSVAIELTEDFVRVAVRDDSSMMPLPHASSSEATSGRGLAIVSGTASGWGTVPLGVGKETWADVVHRAS
jgi:two-component sensor histidine kinase